MKWTDVCVGPMTIPEIQEEIEHYLNSRKKPSKLMVTIERYGEKFYTKIYMPVEDFKKKFKHYNDGKYP
jgi:hypothetical protein